MGWFLCRGRFIYSSWQLDSCLVRRNFLQCAVTCSVALICLLTCVFSATWQTTMTQLFFWGVCKAFFSLLCISWNCVLIIPKLAYFHFVLFISCITLLMSGVSVYCLPQFGLIPSLSKFYYNFPTQSLCIWLELPVDVNWSYSLK